MISPSINILLVDDNIGDARLTREALKEGNVENTLCHVRDGEEALSFLRKEKQYKGSVQPDLILLDLNMPRKDGRETLAAIKSDLDLKRIPVIILTTSKSEKDILISYELHANCFITKPVDLLQFIEVVKNVENFWMTIVKLPPV